MSASPDLGLIVITDARLAAPRSIIDVVRAALDAGAPAIQLRDKTASAHELVDMTRALLEHTRAARALLFVNDRIDVALAAGADGAHLGDDDIPLTAARCIAPPPFLIGCSTDDPARARAFERVGADYIGCGAVFGTTTRDVGDERIGVERVDEVARAVRIPVVAIGGISPANVAEVARTAAAGVAVVSAVMAAPDPAAAVRALLQSWDAARL